MILSAFIIAYVVGFIPQYSQKKKTKAAIYALVSEHSRFDNNMYAKFIYDMT